MEIEFVAQSDFHDALDEIHVFLTLSKENLDDDKKRNLFLRAGILFLATKFECFIEDIIKEYIYNIELLQLTASQLPEPMILSAINHHFSEDVLSKIKHKKPACKEELSKLIPFISEEIPIDKINIDSRFSYGNHGSGIIEKLFDRIGLREVFAVCKVELSRESMLTDEDEIVVVDVKSKIDSLTGIRNGIIHENKSPSITDQHIESYIESLGAFVDKLSSVLKGEYHSLAQTKAS